jgi:hypothetical protein
VAFSSDSSTIADMGANLTLKFKPSTVLKAVGQLSITVPAWYTIQRSSPLDPTQTDSSDAMLDDTSVPVINTPGFKITSYSFDQANFFMLISYKTSADFSDQLSVTISNFKNPVNQRPKGGFLVKTMDANGYLINLSGPVQLFSNLTQIPDTKRSISLLGDTNGNNVGRIGTYQ